jgi:hypothetical protein
MATNVVTHNDQEVKEVAQSADAKAEAAFEKAMAEQVPQATEVPPPSPAEPKAETEQAQEAGSPPVADAPVAAPSLPPAGSEERRNLLAKFNGDEDAAAKAYWETNNRNAEMARKLAEYEAKYGKDASPAPEAAQPPTPVEIPAELKRYDEKLRATEATYRTTHEEFKQWKAEGTRLDKEINGIFRQLSSRDLTLDKDALTEKLTQLNAEREAVTYNLGTLQDRLNGLNEKWEDLSHNRGLAEKLVAQERYITEAREAKARSEEDRVVESIRSQFNGTIDKLTSDATLVPTGLAAACKKHVLRAVKAQLADGVPIADIDKFTRDEIADFLAPAKEYHSVQSAEYAKLKQADAALSAPTGSKAVASETKRPSSDWTPEQWDKHLENVQL